MHRFSNLDPDEISRLEVIRKRKILDSPYETLFNSITRATSEIFNAPIAMISFLEQDRHWFKPHLGLDGKEHLPLEMSFCSHTINSDGVFVVHDTTVDERFKTNPLVIGEPHIKFFAGAPISLPAGEKIGSLCVMDTKLNDFNEYKKAALEGFVRVISNALTIHDVHTRAVLGNDPLEPTIKKIFSS